MINLLSRIGEWLGDWMGWCFTGIGVSLDYLSDFMFIVLILVCLGMIMSFPFIIVNHVNDPVDTVVVIDRVKYRIVKVENGVPILKEVVK